MRVTLTVPGPAAATGRPRFVRGRAVMPERTRLYQAYVRGHARTIIPASWPIDMWYRVELRFVEPRRGDIDNLIKSVLDGLTGVAWRDDAQVLEIAASIRRDTKEPERTQITIDTL